MKKKILPDLLNKYLRGETTPEESAEVDEWYLSLQENPDDISLLDPLELHIIESRIFERVKANIQLPRETKRNRGLELNLFRHPLKLAAAITAIAVIGLGAIFFNQKRLPSLAYKTISQANDLKKIANKTSSVRRLMLEDGSVIALQPNSSVEYPQKFSLAERKIRLTGEAFFDVTKDKNRPFIISAADVTVKVLGTSFNVMAYAGANEISVAVKTGKVSVVKSKDGPSNSAKIQEEVILTPNQEVVYNTAREYFSKKLVAEPLIILAQPTLFETQYDGAPVIKILDVLEENYGIDIQYDEQVLSGCVLTTSMAEEGLYERIEIICKAIGAQYEITDTVIVIKSNGCH